jgi:TPP-dependent pyruvate/acetoin dehydrogenase alpha subunit
MAEINKENLLWAYERMKLIRTFEDRVAGLFAEGKLPGFVHLYAGEEAMGVGVISHLTHRGHGHCIAKGVDVNSMMAEVYGKATGACKGKGGSMHIADVDKGMLGANGIVGAGGPLACGSGLSAKILGTDQVTICFFGDGAAEQGTMHESMNLASIWKLPVVFVCENNGYAETTPWGYHCAAKDISDRAVAYDMPGATVNGTDFFAVYEAAEVAIERARKGQGPSLVECRGFRYYGHFQGDTMLYFTEEEKARNHANDPIKSFKKQVLERGLLSEAEIAEIDAKTAKMVEEAVEFAEESPWPVPEDVLTTDVYVSYP